MINKKRTYNDDYGDENVNDSGEEKGQMNRDDVENIRNINNKKNICKLGTWNIRSLNGKEIELISEFEKAELEILVIPETKKKGNGTMEMENEHLLIWSGIEENKRAQAGIGCILHKNIKENLCNWDAISERILTVELN
ncbi:unnamed protein product [Phaedon cochleariae]|uniref:Uncharacterized protein n=1 Tax=Phaedon cochleariae TaxID=80249 RepID=A0A9N9SL92_PHACE|nr:unnamed protein product [Phaedon cochleariae]